MHVELHGFVALGLVILVGYAAGQAIRLIRLPAIIGYMLVGVLLGPSAAHVLSDDALHKLSFIPDVALGFVAFSIGTELNLKSLRKMGSGLGAIILAESLFAFLAVFVAVYLLTRNLPMALVFGAVAPATAPAGTVAVIQEYKASGSLSRAMYAVAGFDDGLAIIIFGLAAALAKLLLGHGADGGSAGILVGLGWSLLEIFGSLVLGLLAAVIFGFVLRKLRGGGETFAVFVGVVLLVSGIAIQLHLSLILANMVIGFWLANTRRSALVKQVTVPLLGVMPLVFVMFFGLAGAHLDFTMLLSVGGIGVVYVIARSLGKMVGVRVGSMAGDIEDKVKKNLGWAILSQAGVAIGLSLLVNKEFATMGPEAIEIGRKLITTITATCVVFEIVGPVLAKMALSRAGEIPELDERGKPVKKGQKKWKSTAAENVTDSAPTSDQT